MNHTAQSTAEIKKTFQWTGAEEITQFQKSLKYPQSTKDSLFSSQRASDLIQL